MAVVGVQGHCCNALYLAANLDQRPQEAPPNTDVGIVYVASGASFKSSAAVFDPKPDQFPQHQGWDVMAPKVRSPSSDSL